LGKIKSLNALSTDPGNANLGTERGQFQIEESVDKCGYGRSIVVDRHGITIAGNHILNDAQARGLRDDDVIFVHSNGKLVVHVRDDLDLSKDAKARELALRDNRTGQVNLRWDPDKLREYERMGVELEKSFREVELTSMRVHFDRQFSADNIPDAPAPIGETADGRSQKPAERVKVRVRIYVEDGMLVIRPVHFYQEWLTDLLEAFQAVADGEGAFNATI
jgi:hypothetical protein